MQRKIRKNGAVDKRRRMNSSKRLNVRRVKANFGKSLMAEDLGREENRIVTEDDLDGMMKIRYLLGKTFETIQYLEYNLSLLMNHTLILREMKNRNGKVDEQAFKKIVASVEKRIKDDKVDLQTFGNLISTLNEEKILGKKDLDELEDLLKTRNFLTHQYFKKNRFEEQQGNREFLLGQANYLYHILNRVRNYNDRICAQLNYLANQIEKLK